MRGGRFLGMVLVGTLAFGLGACSDDDDSSDDPGDTTDVSVGVDADAIDDLDPIVDDDCEFLLAGGFLNPGAALTGGGDFDFDENADRFAALADEAPDEVAGDLEVIEDRMRRMDGAIGDVDLSDPTAYENPETQAALESLDEIFDDEYNAATQALSTYVAENCDPTEG